MMSHARSILVACATCAAFLLHGCGNHVPDIVPDVTCDAPTATAGELAAGIDLKGQVAIVTGGDGGLGYPVVLALAQQGATVVIASRNLSKCEAIAREVAAKTGSKVTGLALDLSDFASIRKFVKQFLLQNQRLDMLINNAGIAENPQHKSKDGFQLLFAVNYLGPFLLTDLLLPVLRNSGTVSSPSRIVSVASSEHRIACEAAGWEKGCLKDWTHFPPPVLEDKNVTIHYDDGLVVTRSVELYGFSKLLSIEYMKQLSRQEGKHVKAFSLTPGWVNDTLGVYPGINPIAVKEKCGQQKGYPCPFTADQGAAITVFCALPCLDSRSGCATESGGYYSRIKKCHADAVEGNGFTDAMGLELYTKSLKLVGGVNLVEAGKSVVV